MSGGSLNQLYSNEATVFCLNPQITYFKSVYRKHTKFAVVELHQESDSSDNRFQIGDKTINFPFPKQGELISNISLNIERNYHNNAIEINSSVANKFNASYIPDNIGTALFDEIKLKHDDFNNPIDSLTSEYINFHASLNNKRPINATYDINADHELVCNNGNNYQNMALSGGVINSRFNKTGAGWTNAAGDPVYFKKINAIVPIPFSFTKNTGSALPVFLLDKNKLSIELVKCKNFDSLFKTTDSELIIQEFKFTLIFKCIYLSEEEKQRFKSSSQEYLLEKVKYFNSDKTHLKNVQTLNIKSIANNLPIRSLYIVNNASNTSAYKDYSYNFKIRGVNLQQDYLPHEFYSKLKVLENFKGCVYKHDERNGSLSGSFTEVDNKIAYMPFALKNSEGPSGCIDTSTNQLTLDLFKDSNAIATDINDRDIDIYIVYYSILRISDKKISFPYGNI